MGSRSEPGAFERNAPYAPTPDNRPAPLEHSPLDLTREANTQMSFGERAAVEGILAQLRPELAVEIGTAAGGTLARIARYAGEVHSVDISHAELASDVPENVHLHEGPSAELLPPLLAEFTAAGRILDFALVDGDHSFDGVIGDVRTLLDSPCTARSVILVHDSMNAEIRAGLERAGVEAYEKVVYFEPDFIAGYLYAEGAAAGAVWGGLALILCDHPRSGAYRRSVRQWRYREPYEAIHRMRAELNGASADPATGARSPVLRRLARVLRRSG
ncbi:MAG TPA: class I SAM-dependent methyltransferase [Solirubrobacteraceae bacterium]|nr:class I SAM-dependent methyltransferase [Solirubrobacteraceae bacterium]